MSKTMQYAMDTAEKKVDEIVESIKNGTVNKVEGAKQILNVSNVELLGIDEYNVGEVIYEIYQ